ncbi:TCF3 (E2A) fusion partner (in childhood Leukemia) [Nesidiocoris tenuis]|uniref:TCF3 (E2A) fusion partner (In childhood Leukemia) n=1 Tax=Nesidiocoris tenuis TaxID=355587 RepID=A0ABN7BAU1_9HEMI|nr:TCF3 (E2A) fusion partner (in childhood Leukemia) [Nesidiocoris tenuis]
MFSDDSEEEPEEVDVYRKKYNLIYVRCEVIKQDNERLLNRIHHVRRILKRARKERKFLMDRLDMHGDNWRNIPLPLKLADPSKDVGVQSSKLSPPKGSVKSPNLDKSGKKKSSGVRRKGHKADKNAPKRPANPYFQFCQEQRNTAIEEMVSVGQVDPSKVEVTKHLANKWNALTQDSKKIYYDKYEKSKERYATDMQVYIQNKKNAESAAAASSADVT